MYLNSQDDGILNFIPDSLPSKFLSTPGAFTRNSKLSIKETIAFVCSLATGGIQGGIRPHLANFLINNSKSTIIDASNVCRTRYKIKSSAFAHIFREVVNFVYENWNSQEYQCQGRNVIAVDGSTFKLPATIDLKNTFDSQSINIENGGYHYPQCLVSTFYDVYRKIPIHRTMQPYTGRNERRELTSNLDVVPNSSIILLDRGYWGYEVFYSIKENTSHDIVARMPTSQTFKKVEEFAAGNKQEDVIIVDPTVSFMDKWRKGESEIENPAPVTLRLIRYIPPGGQEEVILATTLLDSEKYPIKKITELYWDRWQIELFYRDEKHYVAASKFHSKKKDGILQELFASVLMSVVTRYHLYRERKNTVKSAPPQYLSSITQISDNLIKFISLPQNMAVEHFRKVMTVICSIKYNTQENRPSNLRINKAPINPWKKGRIAKMKKKE